MTQAHPQQILPHGPSLSNVESSELISSQELKHPVGENNRVCIQMYPQRDSKALLTPVIRTSNNITVYTRPRPLLRFGRKIVQQSNQRSPKHGKRPTKDRLSGGI